MHTAQMLRLLKNLQKRKRPCSRAFPLTSRSLLSSQPPRTSSGWCCAGSAGIAGLPSLSCTAASDARSHDLLLSLVYFTERGDKKNCDALKSTPHGRVREASAR